MDEFAQHEIIDPRFRSCVLSNATLEALASGCGWLEGPVWFADHQTLLFSDIPNDRILRWSASGGVSMFREPAGFPNGHARDRAGHLVGCSHLRRVVERTEIDGSRTVRADRFDGRRLNAPNDIVVKSDGTIWSSDPVYGIQTGALLGKLLTPTAVSNLCFGGRPSSRLYLCAGTQLLSVTINQRGASWP